MAEVLDNPASTTLLYEISSPGRRCMQTPDSGIERKSAKDLFPADLLRTRPAELPEVGELDVMRHFNNLSSKNFSIDKNFYPLGSCTMKLNPRICDKAAGMRAFAEVHPYQPEHELQGPLELMYELEGYLREVSGLHAVTLQPAAGAHGELTAIMCFKRYFEDRGEDQRTEILIPDSAHGTNPATAAMAGFKPVTLKSTKDGSVDMELLRSKVGPQTAGMMITNPSTLGIFESNIQEIAKILHDAGALLYMDGANMNAIQGVARPGDFGADCMHFNLHKTYAVPHGGGGPGSGPIAVRDILEPYLPAPRVVKDGEKYKLEYNRPKTIGRVRSYYGNFLANVRAYTYMSALGREGIRRNAENAVLNANYIQAKLKGYYHLQNDKICMHESVFTDAKQAKENDVHAVDIAKRMLDYGVHPMTIYFPLPAVTGGHGALMIEPTESESKQTIDFFISVMQKIAEEASSDPELLKTAPHTAPVKRLDEVRATTNPVLCYNCGI